MQFKPHDYQAHTIHFIETHPEAAIFLGMGLGKTVSTLTALNNLIYNHFAVHKALIIAPLRVARSTWPDETQKWDHLHNLRISVMVGTPTQRQQALDTDADIYVINRENLPWLVKQTGRHWPFDTVVIDELSSFKSHNSQRFKALKKIRPHITRIIGLTGTPAPNSLLDLWAPFRLLDQGQRLGKYITHYRDRYFQPDKRNGAQVYSWRLMPGSEQQIYDAIADITLSMKTTDYLRLPELTTTTRTVTLAPQQMATYRQLRNDMVTDLAGQIIDADSAATLSGRLQQLASGAIYTETGETIDVHDEKIQALADIIDAANGNTVLVAYWFKHELTRLQAVFPHGRALSTSQDITDWCAGKIPVAFIHPASAGHGLNLQSGGHILVWTTVPWSLELYEQTNARLFRQGQTEPVTIIHLAAKGTIDEQVMRALDTKATTQTALVDAVAANLPTTPGAQAA